MADPKKDFARATRRAFEEAWQFEQVAVELERIGSKGNVHFIPWVVNSAFALEVYLKCLYAIENGRFPAKIHSLLDLYKGQTAKSRAAIAGLYAKSVALGPQSSSQDIEMVLEWAKHAFEEWRYRYEEISKPGPFGTNVEIVCNAVRERIIQLRPGWKSYLRNDLA